MRRNILTKHLKIDGMFAKGSTNKNCYCGPRGFAQGNARFENQASQQLSTCSRDGPLEAFLTSVESV